MAAEFLQSLAEQTEALKSQGLFKTERIIASPQQAAIDVREDGVRVVWKTTLTFGQTERGTFRLEVPAIQSCYLARLCA